MTNDNRERILFILRVIALIITIIAAISCSIVFYWTAHAQDLCGAPMPRRSLFFVPKIFYRYPTNVSQCPAGIFYISLSLPNRHPLKYNRRCLSTHHFLDILTAIDIIHPPNRKYSSRLLHRTNPQHATSFSYTCPICFLLI